MTGKTYHCDRHGENKSHNTAQCNKGGKPRNNKKDVKKIHNIEADDKDPQLVQKYNKLQKQINELQAAKNKADDDSNSKKDSGKRYKKRTP